MFKYLIVFPTLLSYIQRNAASNLSISDVFRIQDVIVWLWFKSEFWFKCFQSIKEFHSKVRLCFQFSTMMSEDRPDAFKSVSRKPGLQVWTINVSVLSASLVSHTLDSCVIPFIWVFIFAEIEDGACCSSQLWLLL